MKKSRKAGVLILLLAGILLASSSIYSFSLTYDSEPNSVKISYDSLNRIVSKNTSSQEFNYSYDGQYQGTVSNITSENCTVRYEYDERLRVKKETVIIDGITFEKEIYYDSKDRIVSVVLNNNDLDYYYNKQGRIRKINNFLDNAEYNAFSSILNRSYANSLTTQLRYNPSNNRLNSIITGSVQDLAYTYDSVGNIMSIEDSIADLSYEMGYDSLDRLVNTTINNDLYQYEYNSIGNIKRLVRPSGAKRLVYEGNIPHAPSMVIDSKQGAGIYSAKDLDSGNKNRTFEFWIVKEKLAEQNGINLSAAFGNGESFTGTVNVSSPILALVENNYSNGGEYSVNISTDYDNNLFDDKFGTDARSLELITNNKSLTFIEFWIENGLEEEAKNVYWNCTNGIGANHSFNFTDTALVLIEYNYSLPGNKEIICSVNSDDGKGNKTLEFEIKGLEIENYTVTELEANKKQVSFKIVNYWDALTASWGIKSDSTSLSDSVGLNTGQTVTIARNITYTTDGSKSINVTAVSGSIGDDYIDSFSISALEIKNYDRIDNNDTVRVIMFDVYNEWPEELTVGWNISDLGISNASNLSQSEFIMVMIEENYTSQGRKTPQIKAYSGSFITSFMDSFRIYIVELFDMQVLKQGIESTVTELFVRSNDESRRIDWKYDSGEEIISSGNGIDMNSTDVMVLIESNYSGEGVYAINASINSSSFNDEEQGVVVS